VDYWETGNEIDSILYAHGRPEEHAAEHKAIYLGLKRGNPNAVVLSPSWTGQIPANSWEQDFYEAGAVHDVLNFHQYGPPAVLRSTAAAFRALQQKQGMSAPAWITETGHLGWIQDETEEAAHFVQQYVSAIAENIEKVFGFTLITHRDPGGNPMGFLDGDLSPRPAFAAVSVLTELLGKAIPLGTDDSLPNGVTAVWIDSGWYPIAVAWGSDSGAPLPDSLKGAPLYLSMMGNILPGAPATLGKNPIYIYGLPLPANLTLPPAGGVLALPSAQQIDDMSLVVALRLTRSDDPPLGSGARHYPVTISAGEQVQADVDLYNLSSRTALLNSLTLQLPSGISVSQGVLPAMPLSLVPGQRVSVTLTLAASVSPTRPIAAAAAA